MQNTESGRLRREKHRNRLNIRTFLAGMVVGVIVLMAGAYLYLSLGMAPAATAAAPFPFEKRIASLALKAHIAREMPKQSDLPVTEDVLMAGVTIYRENCAECHGIASEPKTAAARGMYPPPPQLFKGKGVSDDPVGETYWKVENGIRLTGMPAYKGSLTENQIWQVSLLLANSDKLPATATAALAAPLVKP